MKREGGAQWYACFQKSCCWEVSTLMPSRKAFPSTHPGLRLPSGSFGSNKRFPWL